MKPKTTIVLVILLVLVGLGVWITKAIRRHAADRADNQAGKVFPQATEQAKKLVIENSDGTKLVFVHTNDRWNMIEPRLLPASAAAVQPVVNMMTDLKYRRSFSSNGSPAPSEAVMGLDRPRWIITMTDSADRSWTLQVGAAAPNVGGAEETYVRAGENGIAYVVAKNLTNLLQREVKDYRDMTVLPDVSAGQIVALHVEGRENYVLRKHAGRWSVTKPFTAPADARAVQQLLTKLTTGMKAQRILTEAAVSPTPYGLDRPQLVITVATQDESTPVENTQPTEMQNTYTLLLGGHRGKSICAMVKGQPEVFTLPETALDTLQPALNTLLPKTALSFDPANVDRVELQRKDKTIVLQNDGAWSITKPCAGPAEPRPIEKLLETLANLNIKTWIPPLAGQSAAPFSARLTVRLHFRNGTEQTLQVGSVSRDGGTLFCKPAGTTAVAAVKAKQSKSLTWPARKYWSHAMLPFAADAQVLGLTIDRPDGEYVLARCDDAWRLAAPVTGLADADAIATILSELQNLRAKSIVTLGKSLPQAYQTAKDRITVSLTTRDPAADKLQNWRLCVAKIDDAVFAWREGESVTAVGKCSPELYALLTQPLEKTK